jgi:hypothetical protein
VARRRKEKSRTPELELRSSLRKLARKQSTTPIVAGPWVADRVGELLYWIPFLRWAQVATLGLQERLWIVARDETRHWYEGVGDRIVSLDAPDRPEASRVIPAEWITEMRTELSRQRPSGRVQHRLLEFAPLVAPSLPEEVGLLPEFAAVRFSFDASYPETDENLERAVQVIRGLAGNGAAVLLDAPDSLRRELDEPRLAGRLQLLETPGELRTAVLSRASGFVGSYGATLFEAALAGTPTVGLYSQLDEVAGGDLRLAASFLTRPPFGRLHTLEASVEPHRIAEQAVELLESDSARTLQRV